MKNKKILEYISYVVLMVLLVAVMVAGKFKDEKTVQANVALSNKYDEEQKLEQQRMKNLTFYGKLKEKKQVSVLVLGDEVALSLGTNSDDVIWYNKFKKYLETKYSTNIQIKTNASEGNNAFLTWADGNQEDFTKYDAVFVLLGQNDINNEKITQFQIYYENLIRKVIKSNPKIEILPIIESSIRKDNEYTQVINELSKYYSIQNIDIGPSFLSSPSTNKELTKDGVLPNSKGYDIYFNVIKDAIDKNVSLGKEVKYNFSDSQTLYKDTSKIVSCNFIKEPKSNIGFISSNGILSSKNAGDLLEYKINSNIAGIVYMTQTNGGNFRLLIDDKPIKIISTKGNSDIRTCYIFDDNLTIGTHDIKIEIQKGINTAIKIVGVATNK